MISDENLAAEFKAGSREAFEELFHRHRESVYAFFRRRVGSRESAEDLGQEVWVAVMKGSVRYEPRAPFRAYLYGIAFKVLAGERRRHSRRGPVTTFEGPVSEAGSPETDHWVREALNKLDESERDIIMLREYEQLSYEEIAGLTRIPVNTVRSRLFRARLAMKQFLEPNSETLKVRGRS